MPFHWTTGDCRDISLLSWTYWEHKTCATNEWMWSSTRMWDKNSMNRERDVCECHFSVSAQQRDWFFSFSQMDAIPLRMNGKMTLQKKTMTVIQSFGHFPNGDALSWTGKSGSQRWCAQRTQWIVSHYMKQWKKISNQKFASLRHSYYYYFFGIFSIKLFAICPWAPLAMTKQKKMSPREMGTVAMKNVENGMAESAW